MHTLIIHDTVFLNWPIHKSPCAQSFSFWQKTLAGSFRALAWGACEMRGKTKQQQKKVYGFWLTLIRYINRRLQQLTTTLQHVQWKKHHPHHQIQCPVLQHTGLSFSFTILYLTNLMALDWQTWSAEASTPFSWLPRWRVLHSIWFVAWLLQRVLRFLALSWKRGAAQ